MENLLSSWNKHDRAKVSEALRQNGVPGIRYLDQGSRAAGEGTSNYVVFPGNEHLIEILRRYANASSPTGVLASTPQSDKDQVQRILERLGYAN